jgi:hypothetical protein
MDKAVRSMEDALCHPSTDRCGGVVRFLTYLNSIAEDPPQRDGIPLAAPDQQPVELTLDKFMTPLPALRGQRAPSLTGTLPSPISKH